MTIENKIKDEKLQYDINRDVTKISALSSGKIDKYETLLVRKYYPQINKKLLNKLNLLILLWEKLLKNRQKKIEDQGEKQTKTIQDKSIENIKKCSDYDNDYKKELLKQKKEKSLKIFTMTDSIKYKTQATILITTIINYDNHVLVLEPTDKLDLTRGQKTVALSNLSIYYTWKNIKSSYNNNKFKKLPIAYQ